MFSLSSLLFLSTSLFVLSQAKQMSSTAPTPVRAITGATIRVPDDQPTIQAGIDVAQNGDLVLVDPGTYQEHDIRFWGKQITVRGVAGAALTTVDAQGLGRGFHFSSGETSASVLEGFTITNGNARFGLGTSTRGDAGGGIYVLECSPTIRACILRNNEAYPDGFVSSGGGGAYFGLNSQSIVEGCVFLDNFAGDGLDVSWDAMGTEGGNGGGVFAADDASPRIIGCSFFSNRAGDGGRGGDGLFTPGGQGGWGGDGGGLWTRGGARVVNSVFVGNQAGGGGGPGLPGGQQGYGGAGGGVHAFSANFWLANCVILDNSLQPGAGFTGGGVASSNGTHGNLIVRGNAPDQFVGTTGHLVGIVGYSNVEGGLAGTGNIDVDPRFLNAAQLDFRLLPGSPCIDAGDNATVPPDYADLDADGNFTEPTPLDLAGHPRFLDDPRRHDTGSGAAPLVDMGATEFFHTRIRLVSPRP